MINQEITQLEANTFEENVVLPISETFSGQYASKQLANLFAFFGHFSVVWLVGNVYCYIAILD